MYLNRSPLQCKTESVIEQSAKGSTIRQSLLNINQLRVTLKMLLESWLLNFNTVISLKNMAVYIMNCIYVCVVCGRDTSTVST